MDVATVLGTGASLAISVDRRDPAGAGDGSLCSWRGRTSGQLAGCYFNLKNKNQVS